MADNTLRRAWRREAAFWRRFPRGVDLIQAAALPRLVTTTGNQLFQLRESKRATTVMVIGAVGSSGRSAAFTAKERGAGTVNPGF